MSAGPSRTAAELSAWIVDQGLVVADPEAFLAELGPQIAALVPLDRFSIGVPTLDPNIRGVSVTWNRNGRIEQDLALHGPDGDAAYRLSPIFHARQNDIKRAEWNLAGGEGIEAFPLLEKLAAEGMAHYVLRLVAFPNEPHIAGMAISFATRASNGFSVEDHATIDCLLPPLGLTIYRILLSHLAAEMLSVYVGPRTSERILAGAVHRNEGEFINAVILFCDLKGFTEFSEIHSSQTVLALLNEHFDVLDTTITQNGGEILKFLGDGLLAVFPLDGEQCGQTSACMRALRAATHVLVATRDLNGLRRTAERPEMEIDIALHVGKVFYGNVGAARRLDFTVIGAAVNLASRIEQLCDGLGRNLVLSQPFAEQCGIPAVPLGVFKLKGIREPQAVFGYDGEET